MGRAGTERTGKRALAPCRKPGCVLSGFRVEVGRRKEHEEYEVIYELVCIAVKTLYT